MAANAAKTDDPFTQRTNIQNELPSVEMALAELDSQRRPYSAPHWLTTASVWPFEDFFAPGMVQQQQHPNNGGFDPFLFPPAPPRYSSLEVPTTSAIMVSSGRPRLAIAAARRPSLPPVGQSTDISFMRSPPPPYVPSS